MVLTATVLAVGTIVEKINPEVSIYGTWWFAVLLALVAVAAVVSIVQGKMWRRPSLLLIHASVAVILMGGALTTWTGQHGSIVLHPGVRTIIIDTGDGHTAPLPFEVELTNFEVVPYPGTHTPMDFVSHLLVDGKPRDISMNHILKHRGYRFYQEDYGDDGSSTLSVAHDPWGIGVTYCGYALLIIGLLWLLVSRKGPFRQLLKGAALVALLLAAGTASAQPRTLPKETADQMGRMYMLYKGRVCPVQTYAKDFTTKLTGKATYRGLTAEQVLAGYLYYFSDWADEPAIKGQSCAELSYLDGVRMSPTTDKKTRQASERYNLVKTLLSGRGLKLFPLADSTGAVGWYAQNDMLPLSTGDDAYLFVRKQQSYCQELVVKGDYKELQHVFAKTCQFQEKQAAGALPSPSRIAAERLYNTLTTGRWLAMLSITFGLICFAYTLWLQSKRKTMPRWLKTTLVTYLLLLTAYLTVIFVLRWIVGGHAPMAGGFDSMNLMAMVIGIVSLVLSHHYRKTSTLWYAVGSADNSQFSLSAGMMTMGFCLLVAMMSGSNPPVTNLMPVLNSPLLTLHVAVIMCSYALFFFVMMGGVAGLISNGEEYRRLNLLLLYPAVTLLAVGIIIGAVWANISWGNYWSWDPKEVWALITLIIYTIPLHRGVLRHPRAFHLYCVLAFLSVVITYFGVNLILGGMHAYN